VPWWSGDASLILGNIPFGGPMDPSAPNTINWIKRHQIKGQDLPKLCLFAWSGEIWWSI